GLPAHYVFAYSQGSDVMVNFRPADLGITDPVYIYNYFAGTGTIVAPGQLYAESAADGRVYYVIAPIGPSGIALLGDRRNFVSLGRKRISSLTDDGVVHVTVSFAAGEIARTLFGFAPSAPAVSAATGGVSAVSYDPSSQRFTVEMTPSPDGTASVDLHVVPTSTPDDGYVRHFR